MLFQVKLQTGDEASTCARSTSHVPSSSNSATDVTTEPSDGTTTTTYACKANIAIDYPVNAMKKTFARHIACGVDELTKLRCYGCEKDHPSQRQHDCFLPEDILIDMYFDDALEKVNSTAVIRDWLTLLLEVNLTQSDVALGQLNAVKSWLEEYPSEQWRNNVKRMILAPWEDDL